MADAQLLFDLDSDPEVMRYFGPRPAPDVAGHLDRTRTVYLPQQEHPWHGVCLVHDRAGGEFLGWVFIRPAPASKIAADALSQGQIDRFVAPVDAYSFFFFFGVIAVAGL